MVEQRVSWVADLLLPFHFCCNSSANGWWRYSYDWEKFPTGVGLRQPEIILPVSLTAVSTCLACNEFAQTGAAYSAVERQSAMADAITKLDQLEVQLNTADFTASPAQLAALYGNITRAIENATEGALQEGYALLESAPGSESVKRRVEELESRKIQLNLMCVESSERSIKTSKVLNNFLEKQNQLYSWLVSTAQSFIQGHQDMGSVLAMAKDFLQQHNKMLNELQMKSTEINALLSTLPATLETLDAESQRDCKAKAEELVRQSDSLREALERRTELARTFVKFHSLAVELASDMDALDDTLNPSTITTNALNSCKQRWLNVQQVFLQFVNTGTNFNEDSYKVGDPHLDVEQSRLGVSTLIEHFTTRKAALTTRHSQCEQALFNRQQTVSLWQQTMADANQTVDWVSKLDAQLYPVMNEEITSSSQMSKDIEFKMKTVLPEVKKALTEVQSRIRTANDLIGTGEVPNRDDSVLIKLKELEDKLHVMISDYQVLLEMLISFFNNLSELENKCSAPTGALGETVSMDLVERMIKDHDANRQTLSELFRFTHSESLQIIDKIKIQEPEPAREKDISTLRRIVEDKRSVWERSWTERRLELDQSQQLCQFDVDLEHIYKNIEQLEEQLISVRGQYGESLATAKATSLTFLYFEKTIELLQQRIETFVSAAEVMSKTDGNSSKHIQVEVSRLRKRWEEFEKQVSESRRLIDLSIQFFTLVEEAEDWFREGSQLLVTIARRSAVSKTPEDATEMLNELEIFFKPGESIQDDRINKIADLAEQLFVGEARPPAQVSQVREESREMKTSFQQVTKELKSLLEGYKEPEKMDVVPSEPPVTLIKEQHTTTHVTSTEKTIIEVVENGVTTVRKQKSPSPPPKKAKYQEIEAIPMPPQFSQPLADAVINEGSRFTFQCRVTGKPTPSVQWLKDGMSIGNNPDYLTKFSDDGLCSLTIEETFTEDSALFTCRAVNSAGTTDTSAKLTVKECAPEVEMTGPLFLQPLLSVTGVEGGSCSMTCQVDGNPLPTVQWSKGDVCIDHSPDYSITFNNGLAVMTIDQLAPADQAQYTCKASNQLASDSSTAWLFVRPKESQESPKFIAPLSPNFMARAGQKIRLECQVAGKPVPTITWSFNGKPINESKDHLQVTVESGNATLVIDEAYPKDAGTYTVTAVNSAGEASQSCQVSVKGLLPTETSDSELASDSEPVKPSIQLQLKDCAVFEGMKVRLDCIIVGQPEPEVIWYHEERPVKESEDFQLLFHGDRCSLIIQEAYVEDSGDYKVVAINSAGEASSKCRLTVQSVGGSDVKGATRQAVETTTREKKVEMSVCSMPKFTQLLTDVLVPVGESVTLECTVSGQPMPVVAWLHNSRTIVPSDRIKWEQSEDGHCTLHIDNVTVEDKGNYTALVQSKMGEAKCFAHLIVKGSISDQEAEARIKHDDRPVLPSFTELFADRIVCLGEPTKFECIVAGKPKPKVRWLFNDKPVAGKEMLISTSGPRQVLSIPSVTSETAGQITCVAENEAGKAACTAKLAISDAPIDILLPTLDNIKLSETEGGVEMRRQVVSESSSSRVYSSGTTIASHGSTTEHPPTVHVQSVSSRSELASHKIGDQPAVQIERHETMEYQQKDGLVSEQKTELKSKSIGGVTSVDKSSSSAIQPVKRKLIPPKFSTLVMGKIVDQGVDVSLEGIVDGFPQPDVKWLKNGEELISGANLNITQDLNRVKLTISSVSASDAGKYTCTASNSAGSASCTADLVVKTTQSHSGKYTACAVNSAGESKSTADLLVQQPQLPMDIIEQTTTNITSSHEVIHHPQPMKSIENLKSSESLYKESASSHTVEQTKLSVSQQHQQQRPAKRSVGPPPCSPSKFVKGEFRESDYESDYEGRIPVKWRPSQNIPDVENREFKPVHPVLEVSKRLSSNRDGRRSPTPPSAFDVVPPSSFSKTKDIFENSQLVKPKALTAVSLPTNVGFPLKPGSPPRMDYAAPYYKIPTGSVGLETSNSMSFAEATESSKRVVSMQQTTRVIKFDDKKTKRSQIIRPVNSDVESDYESGKVKTSWPPENPLQFEAEQKRLQRVEEMRRRFSDKTSTPPILTPGEPPQYGFIQPHSSVGQSTVDASSLANKHMNEMSHSFKSKAQKFASDVMTDVQVTKQGKTENSLQKTTSDKTDDSQAYREESRLSEYGKKQIDPDTGLIYFKYDFGYEFGVVLPGEGKPGGSAKAIKMKPESTEGSVPVPVIHETTRKSDSSAKRLSAKSVKWEQTSESEMSDTGFDVARRKKQPPHPQYEPHILIPHTPSPQSLSPSLHSLSPYFTHGNDLAVSPGSSLASGLSPGGVNAGASPVVNPSTVPEHARKAPLFITPLRNIAVLTGNAARFECIVQAEPAPNILWAHDGRILQPSEMHNIEFRNGVCRLTMPKAELSDAGTYTCTATNLLGTSGTTASLQVSGERRSLLV
ncbi:hypothetical protein LSTR_LSTR011242 [Laodelphax striatellus]|uniref:Ig-like domain-containing protein n=1 Tax=Laodelphax striatellus TaxID=195883 RepID=A0A482X2W2_LAOST|nr:hypothetical protein LSTR_LSTR011242 [Laodelphax striatellus]